MEKTQKESKFRKFHSLKEWSFWARVIRLIGYLLGFVTIFFYFWSFIGIIIGVLYFFLFKDIAWKRNGLYLAFSIAFTTTFIFFYKGIPPLNSAMYLGLSFFFGYLIILIIWELLKKKSKFTERFMSRLTHVCHNVPKIARKLTMVAAVIIPILFWSFINIDLRVMFDNGTQLLWINAPSKVDIDEPFELTVQAWDFCERLSATYKGTVQFSIKSYNATDYSMISSPIATLPVPYTFSGQLIGSDMAYEIKDGKDNGRQVFDASIGTMGIHYILVNDSYTRNVYYSNPILVTNESSSEPLIVWGDIHTHSHISDGSGSAEHSFYYARHVAGLDYYSLSDHGEIMLFGWNVLDFLETITNNVYEPNEFVTFHGIEWTEVTTGHYVCIFSGNRLLKSPVLSYMTVPKPSDLWNALDDFTEETGDRALALPHHPTKKSYIQDWTYLNPKYVKLAEVTSVHGEFLFEQRHELNYRGAIDPPPEYTHGSSIIDALKMGYRLTLYTGSDEHDGHPGHSLSHTRAYIGHQRPFSIWHTRNEHPYPGGLTAAFSDNLTREGVFDALENQRIYATSDHGRPILMFSINNTRVGDGSTFVAPNQTSTREINIFLAQDGAPVALKSKAASVTADWNPNWNCTVEIIKNGLLWNSMRIDSPVQNITIIDSEPITGTSYDNCINVNGNSYINSYSDNPVNPTSLSTGGFDFYLVRVVGDNGRIAYAGPIWVEYSN